MKRIDFKKELKHLYKPSAKNVEIVDVPAMDFLMIDGQGDPNSSRQYAQAVEALFATSYTLKFIIKKGGFEIDYGVMPLQGLWWADNMDDFVAGNRENWKWTMMIMQPDFITAPLVAQAIDQVGKKKNLPAVNQLRFEAFTEGKAAQIMHIGPFTEEGPTIARLHQFIEDSGYRKSGRHHEIYLSDIRRAAPEKWKTVLRQPFVGA